MKGTGEIKKTAKGGESIVIINDIQEGRTNIVDNKTVRKIINDVLTDVSEAVKFTLGPAGNTSLLHDPGGVTSLYPNKDGYNQIMNMHYDDYFYDSVLKIIRDAAMHCNVTVGDATTSSVVILENFYKTLRTAIDKKQFDYVSDSGIVTILEVMKDFIRDGLYKKGYIKKITDTVKDPLFENINVESGLTYDQKIDVLTKVATVAANNDIEVGKFIAHIFDKAVDTGDEVDVEISPNTYNATTESTEIGFYMPTGYINRIFHTERDGRTAIYHEPRFLLIEGPLLDGDVPAISPFINYVCNINHMPLVIIAGDFSEHVAKWLYMLRIGGKGHDEQTGKPVVMPPLDILPMQYSSGDDLGREKLMDLEIALGAKILPLQSTLADFNIPDQPMQMELMLGRAKKIVAVTNESRIIQGMGSPEKVQGRIEQIAQARDDMVIKDSTVAQFTIAEYNERIAMLKSNMISIKVGGISYKERQYMVRVYEDAVYACKACIKYGYTLIGQSPLFTLLSAHEDELANNITTEILKTKNNVIFVSPQKTYERLLEVVSFVLVILKDTVFTAYRSALENAIKDKARIDEIFKEITTAANIGTPISYNIIDDTYYSILSEQCPIYSAGSTDWEVLNAIISVIAIFFNVHTLMTLYIPSKEVKIN